MKSLIEKKRSFSLGELKSNNNTGPEVDTLLSRCSCHVKEAGHIVKGPIRKCYRDCFHFSLNNEKTDKAESSAKVVSYDQTVPKIDLKTEKKPIERDSIVSDAHGFNNFSNLNFYKQCNVSSKLLK